MSLTLSVLDQCPVQNNQSASEAVNSAVRLAQLCDELGYHRYWIAEHHDTPSYSSSCPEIVIGQIAANTQNIRVGSGGVMLTHYSPYKVAEVFRTLEAFYPGRIDLGFGRAPGGAENSSHALAWPYAPQTGEAYGQSVELLQGFMHDLVEGVRAMPFGGQSPQLWTLGSSGGSVELAAAYGLGFVLALFIGTHERPAEIIKQYKQQFRPHPRTPDARPEAIIASAVICADSKEEAYFLAASHTYWKVMAGKGIREGLRTPEDALDKVKALGPADRANFDKTRDSMITGTAAQCREELQRTADFYDVDEVLCVNVLWDNVARRRSYEMLMKG